MDHLLNFPLQIIWLTDNRIRDLSLESFSKYGSLKYLYINENMVQTVEEGTFAQLPNLEVIDLSSNALTTIPLEIFQLTQLRNLYVADNNLFHLEADLKVIREIFVESERFLLENIDSFLEPAQTYSSPLADHQFICL